MIKPDVVQKPLTSRGYKALHATTKKVQFQKVASDSVYVNLTSKSGLSTLIVHPSIDLSTVAHSVQRLKVGESFYHSSNMLAFPRRMHRGKQAICFGKSLSFDSESALQKLLDHIEAA